MSSVLTSPESVERESLVRALLDEFGLAQTHMNALKLYNAHQPYHNWHHCAVVALSAIEAARESHVPESKQRLLLLAALYHDYDHTGEPQKADILNIVRAVSGSQFWLGVKEPSLSRAEKNEIVNIIAATEATHSHKPRSALESIIIDADVLATTGSDREQWWAALSEEQGVEINAENTVMFLRSQNFHSLWGIKRAHDLIPVLQDLVPGR